MSKADPAMSNKELQHLLLQAKQANAKCGITGMLIYVEGLFTSLSDPEVHPLITGRFIQVLEGSKKDVQKTFKKIEADTRHQDVVILQESEKMVRDFENWWMGFRSFTLEEYSNLPAFFHLDNSFVEFADQQLDNLPLQFLKSFYQEGQI